MQRLHKIFGNNPGSSIWFDFLFYPPLSSKGKGRSSKKQNLQMTTFMPHQENLLCFISLTFRFLCHLPYTLMTFSAEMDEWSFIFWTKWAQMLQVISCQTFHDLHRIRCWNYTAYCSNISYWYQQFFLYLDYCLRTEIWLWLTSRSKDLMSFNYDTLSIIISIINLHHES